MKIVLNQESELHITEQAAVVTFNRLQQYKELRHGFSTRMLGVSKGIYASMNLGFGRGDSDACVRENYRRICGAIGIPDSQLVFPKQTHKTMVRTVTKADCGIGIIRDIPYDDVDAHMTNEPYVPLVIFSADCVPIFYYDPENHAIALCHAGWRGTVNGIAAETVTAMSRVYGTNPENLQIVIGPCIGMECFEIGEEVAEEFREKIPRAEEQGILKRDDNGEKFHADLPAANQYVLSKAGVRESGISRSGLCTMCRQDLFFSHRGTGGRRGSNAGFFMLT